MRCAIAVPPQAPICGACLIEPPPFALARAVVDFAYPWDVLIQDFKFRDALELAPALSRMLVQTHVGQGQPAPELLIPVPLSAARLSERGYNQSWELARRCAQLLDCEAESTLLLRIRDTAQQLNLPRQQRATNVRGAFAVEPSRRSEVRGRTVTLLDDVITTTATVSEAARTLLAAGASAVHVWAVARTPTPTG